MAESGIFLKQKEVLFPKVSKILHELCQIALSAVVPLPVTREQCDPAVLAASPECRPW